MTGADEVPKVIRDGKVAVIVSPDFGAGWSTWANNPESAVFAPDVVAWIEAGKQGDVAPFFKKYGTTLGLEDAEIHWVAQGDRFNIEEYDGAESLAVYGPDWGYQA